MHTAIFIADIPSNLQRQKWDAFLGLLDVKIRNATNVVRLSENVWLVKVKEDPGPLGQMIAIAQNQGVSYGILPIAVEPEWLPAGFYPKTI